MRDVANDNSIFPIEQLYIGIFHIPAFTFTVHCFPDRQVLHISINVIDMDTAVNYNDIISWKGNTHAMYCYNL